MKSLILYITIFLLVFILNNVGSKQYKKHKCMGSFMILFSFLLLVLLIGCRENVGTDYDSYLYYYRLISNLKFNELSVIDWEYGALFVFKWTSILFKSNHAIMIVLAFLTIYPIYKLNKLYEYRYLPYSVLTYCFIFLPFSTNGMRQAIAMSFILLATGYLIKEKKRKSFFFLIIAYLFHKSAMIVIPYLALFQIRKDHKIERDQIFMTLVLCILILFFNHELINLGFISEYEYYLENISIQNISLTAILFHIPIIMILLGFSNKQESHLPFLKGLTISGIILDVVGTSKQYLSRISLYYTMFEVLLIPILLQHIQNQTTKKLVSSLYCCFLIGYFIYQFYLLGRHEIFPYQTWLLGG